MSSKSSAPNATLQEIAAAQQKGDVAALTALEGHADKEVRKAARKALHVLKSKGVKVEQAPRKVWSAAEGDSLREAGPKWIANVDTKSSPGVTQLVLSELDDEDGAVLFLATLDGNDRLVDFAAYSQSDGQRTRMFRDWNRNQSGRLPPADWVKQRLLFAREKTSAAGYTAPGNFDEHLRRFGAFPSERPKSFLQGLLPGSNQPVELTHEATSAAISGAGLLLWPLMFNIEAVMKGLAEESGDKSESPEDAEAAANERSAEEHRATLRKVAAQDPAVDAGMRGPLRNALEDAALGAWIDGRFDDARVLTAIVSGIDSTPPGSSLLDHDWATQLLSMQLAAYAMRSLRNREGMA